jgi:hypothetical protein
MNDLTTLFPGAVEQKQKAFAELELEKRVPANATNKRELLVDISTQSDKVDQIMQQVAAEAIEQVDRKHVFNRNEVSNGARAAFGDQYGKGAEKQLGGPGHHYNDTRIIGRGTRVALGDRYNMADPLGGPDSE